MSIDSLPTEIIEGILLSRHLDYTDIVQFSKVSLRFSLISKSNEIWHQLFKHEFKSIYRNVVARRRQRLEQKSWREEFILRMEIGSKTGAILTNMSERFYQQTELSNSDFRRFDVLLQEQDVKDGTADLYALDYVRSVSQNPSVQKNLTNKYYGKKVARHIQQKILKSEIKKFTESNNDCRNSHYEQYEKALVLIAQWCQPEIQIVEEDIHSALEKIAKDIFSMLGINKIGDQVVESLSDLKSSNKDSYIKTKIFEAANHLLGQEGFQGNSDDYYNANNSFINKILDTKLGIPISLSLMYLAVLGRMGVCCEPVNFPRHFLLRWNENKDFATPSFRYIDVFNKGKQMSKQEALSMIGAEMVQPEDAFEVADALASTRRMMRNLISIGASHSNAMRDSSYSLLRSSLEMMLLLNNDDVPDFAFMLCRVYIQLNINHEEVEKILSDFTSTPGLAQQADYLISTAQMQLEEKKNETKIISPKRRDDVECPFGNVRLRVGTVAKHKRYDYKCVVYGWDTQCTASRSWIRQMGVDRLNHQDKQPFYNVLVEDGSNRYAADENLEVCAPVPIPHSEIGKYFKEFCKEKGYLPNSELAQEYPQD